MFAFSLLSFLSHSQPVEKPACPLLDPQVIERQLVYESDYHHVLLDHRPIQPGHMLIVPKRAVRYAHELTDDEWTDLGRVTKKTIGVFKSFLQTEQYFILEKNGPDAGQTVDQVHFHIVPITPSKYLPRTLNTFFKIFLRIVIGTSPIPPKQLSDSVVLFKLAFID